MAARHPRSPELENASLEDIVNRYVARFADRRADWTAFEDAKIEGYRRAQHRFISAGSSGKHEDHGIIPPSGFKLSIMYVEPGQGNAPHTHEVEEAFFVLDGFLDVFIEDEGGRRITKRLGKWECISAPAGVIHGYDNNSLAPCYFQVMLGRGRPETMGMRGRGTLQTSRCSPERSRLGIRYALKIHAGLVDDARITLNPRPIYRLGIFCLTISVGTSSGHGHQSHLRNGAQPPL